MNLLHYEFWHFLVSLLIAVFIYFKYRKISFVIVVFLVGIFLDIDHGIDLLLAKGTLAQISSGMYFATSNKVYVFFHSWELLLVWWLFILYILPKIKPGKIQYDLGWTVTLAFIGHILVDQFTYQTYPLTYFLTYRTIHNFNLKEIFR